MNELCDLRSKLLPGKCLRFILNGDIPNIAHVDVPFVDESADGHWSAKQTVTNFCTRARLISPHVMTRFREFYLAEFRKARASPPYYIARNMIRCVETFKRY